MHKMGSGGSRLRGATMVRAPLFLYRRLDKIKKLSRPLIGGSGPRPSEYKEISSKDDVMRKKFKGEYRQNDDDNDDDADSDEDEEDGEGGMIGRDYDHGGSPSFRIYVKSDGKKKKTKTKKEDAKHGHNGKIKNIHALDGSISSDDIEQSQESCINKHKEEKKKKSRKRSKSLSMICKGGQAAVKNLFNVKRCYYISAALRPPNRRSHLITEKETVV